MKTLISAILLASAFAGAVSAQEYDNEAMFPSTRIGFMVDFQKVAMEDLNNDLDKGTKVTHMNSGVRGMLNFDIALIPSIMVGLRSGYLYCIGASTSYNLVIYNQTTTVQASMIPLEIGITGILDFPFAPVSIMGSIYGGEGFAFSSFKNDLTLLGQTGSYTQPYYGAGFIGEALVGLNFKTSGSSSFNIHGGYLMANIEKMKLTKDITYNDIPGLAIPAGAKGDVRKDDNNMGQNDLAFDFSGLTIGIGITTAF